MIDVPVRVKDALRDGRLRKNYRFKVQSVVETVSYTDIHTFTSVGSVLNVPQVGTFEWYSETGTGVVAYYSLTKTDESVVTGDVVSGASISLGYGDSLELTVLSVPSVILRLKETTSELVTDFTIDNDSLVKESVKFDERMCSGSELKFGLCEGASLEFQYFDHPNITGKQIQAFIDVQYVDSDGDLAWHSIPMGFYTVDQCPMQYSTGIHKVTAYNKLRSKYLDQKANALIEGAFEDLGVGQTVKFYDLRRLLLNDYEIEYFDEDTPLVYTEVNPGWGKCSGQSIKFKAKYGIDTPLNWRAYKGIDGASASMPNMFPIATHYEFVSALDPQKSYVLKLLDFIIAYEESVYNTIIDIINKSMNVTGQSFVDAMMSARSDPTFGFDYAGWSDFCGIFLTKEDDTTEQYSTIGFNHNASGVIGTFDDLSLKTLSGYKQISIHLPYFLRFSDSGDLGDTAVYYFVAASWGAEKPYYGYGYWADSSMSWSAYNTYCFFYPNTDTPIEEDDLMGFIKTYEVNLSDADLIDVDPRSLADITLRDTLSSVYELEACYGKLDRTTDLFAPVELNGSRLVPSDTLYPANDLYPNGNSARANKSMYQKLWTDSQGNQKFRYLYITYKGLDSDNKEVEKVLQRTVNADGTTDYNMSDNWLFKNLVWSDADVGDYADTMVLKMKDISWFPFEMWCAGLPYIETGDELEITNSEGTYTSYVLQRQLNGIQNLQDTFIDGELDIF